MRFSELDGAKIGVWGAGREIRSLAAQLATHLPSTRIAVVVLDADPEPGQLEALGSPRLGGVDDLAACDVVVRSPGVPVYRPELQRLRAAGTPVTTATALWLAERGGEAVIGITGTKGKSTTAALAAHLAGARLAGNIGAPALDLLGTDDLAVVELSSYQIADLDTGPEIVAITNLYREHTDWHGSEETYHADKLRILGLPGVRAAVVNGRDPRLTGVDGARFGTEDGWNATPRGVTHRGRLAVTTADLPLRGEHNALNLCAALGALDAYGFPPPSLPDGLRGFRPLRHRLEVVLERDGVVWVDDSISTTPESALAAVASFPDREVVLIGGGHERSQDYAELGWALGARKAAVIGLPTTGARLLAAARAAGAERTVDAADMESAVAQARQWAEQGSVVLLSPAAPSFNAYRNFEERGDHFASLASAAPLPNRRER